MLRYKIEQDASGEWYATIWASSDQIFRTGDGYVNKEGAQHAVDILIAGGLVIAKDGD